MRRPWGAATWGGCDMAEQAHAAPDMTLKGSADGEPEVSPAAWWGVRALCRLSLPNPVQVCCVLSRKKRPVPRSPLR